MKIRWIGYLLPALFIPNVYSWVFKSYPYADLNIEEKIISDGYPFERYEVTTEDNYIITLFRITFGKRSKILTNRSPVLLLHGLGGTSELYVVQGKNRSLPYNLVDEGFDVWLRIWIPGFHEIAVYDVPASIDYIMEKTHQKVFVIGHSQGNTCYFITTCARAEYNDKIKLGVVYGPSIFVGDMDYPIVMLISYMVDIIEALYNMFGIQEAIPFMPLMGTYAKRLCREQTYFLQLCSHLLSVIGTHESKLIDKDLIPAIVGSPLPRLSSQQVFHYMQITKSGKFKQYDHGAKKNLQVYGKKTPPEYDVNKSTTPLAVFYGETDGLASKKAAEKVIRTFPNVIYHHQVDFKDNHIDFLFARNASTLVYQKTVQLFKDYDNGVLSKNGTKITRS